MPIVILESWQRIKWQSSFIILELCILGSLEASTGRKTHTKVLGSLYTAYISETLRRLENILNPKPTLNETTRGYYSLVTVQWPVKIFNSHMKYWPLTFLVSSTSVKRAHQERNLCTFGGYEIWNLNKTLKNQFCSTRKHNKLKQTRNNAIAQNKCGLKHLWVREIFQ